MVFFVDAGAEGLDGNGKNKMIDDGYEERGFADGDGMVGVGVVETSRLRFWAIRYGMTVL